MLSVHLWARININIIRLLWKIPERDYNQRFLRRRTGEKKKREINGPFLNALKAVSITFSQHIVKLFHRANRSFISQPLLPTQGPWVDPGKKEDFGNLSSGGRGFQLVFEKGLGETWSRVITSTTFLSIPCTRFAFPQDLHQREVQDKYVGWQLQVWVQCR